MSLASIKSSIKTDLDALVTAGTLAGATQTDIRRDPLSADVGSYPHAFLMPPEIAAESLDNRTNLRSYTFDIMVLYNAENLASTTDLEASVEAILDQFDNDPTLGGTALAGLSPAATAPQPFQHGGKDLVMVVVQLTAREAKDLSFG